MGILCTLFGCNGIEPAKYVDQQPKADIKEFFNGPIKAWGLIQDRSGNVISRFDVDMIGKWQGDVGTLEEDFTYYDGSTQKRIWTIKELEGDKYEGTAGDIIGKADGEVNGSMIYWKYEMDVPVDDKTYRLKFDDYMWQMNDGVVINRSYFKKFGFTVAELTLIMQKQ
ncbi:MAG: hypothetical protein COV36_02515 [Alphaproteobacteria bacterium CG11_big_fil_rev_8_21_14_0_20_44_7]|nr:MAG: hypothetical protein COV36_02515 [Alphaproteobacteria bacterium CG11_big_fil_rev_8_21_14_0_20_44_7]